MGNDICDFPWKTRSSLAIKQPVINLTMASSYITSTSVFCFCIIDTWANEALTVNKGSSTGF